MTNPKQRTKNPTASRAKQARGGKATEQHTRAKAAAKDTAAEQPKRKEGGTQRKQGEPNTTNRFFDTGRGTLKNFSEN
jgi:hypothetical protein